MNALGGLLVALQFALLAVLLAFGGRGWAARLPPPDAFVLAAGAVALGLWALSANRPGNFNIRPLPRAGGQLVRSGPYRWIRHPMYSALLLGGAACARAAVTPLGWAALLALALVLAAKAAVEERALLQRHPDYRAYRQHTHRFLPFGF